jgi:hypothetical protein
MATSTTARDAEGDHGGRSGIVPGRPARCLALGFAFTRRTPRYCLCAMERKHRRRGPGRSC